MNAFIACPTCHISGTLTSRTRFERVTITELEERYPHLYAHLVAAGRAAHVGPDDRFKAAVPELVCQSCGAVFDAASPPPNGATR